MRRWHLPRSGEVDAVVDGDPHQVFAVVSDVTRIAEWSHECYGADWLDGATGPEVGVRFQGRNRAAWVTWSRVCTITELTPGRRFAYVTGGSLTGDSTRWTFDLEAQEDGTRVRQSFEVLRLPRLVELFVIAFIPDHGDRLEALHADLLRLGEVAAGRQRHAG